MIYWCAVTHSLTHTIRMSEMIRYVFRHLRRGRAQNAHCQEQTNRRTTYYGVIVR